MLQLQIGRISGNNGHDDTPMTVQMVWVFVQPDSFCSPERRYSLTPPYLPVLS